MGGWHLRMTWGQEVCYASFQWMPASALSLLTVWSQRGNPGVSRCQEMATLPAGYIPQCRVPSASSSGSLGFLLYVQCCTGCLNLLCPTSNQHFFRLKWHSKQKALIFGILSRGDLCMDNQILGCLPYTASTASYLKDAIFLMIQWRKTCLIFCS